MKMEVIAVQNQFQSQYGALGSSKVRDWTTTLTAPLTTTSTSSFSNHNNTSTSSLMNTTAAAAAAHRHPYLQTHSNSNSSISSIIGSSSSSNKIKLSINNKNKPSGGTTTTATAIGSNPMKQPRYHTAPVTIKVAAPAAAPLGDHQRYNSNLFFCDDLALDTSAVQELSARLLDELRAAKSRHLTCTEVSLPCDLTPRIAAEIIRVSAKEPCGLRGCTIYIEFEDEPNNSRRIASLKIDPETVSTFEVYLTLRQDHRGWTALLPQFMKSLARTITISPEFTITKNKLYAAQQLSRSSSISYSRPQRAPLATPTS